jgi:hypothetical protein
MHECFGLFLVVDYFSDLFTEVVSMRLRSVVALQLGGHHRGEQLALHAR